VDSRDGGDEILASVKSVNVRDGEVRLLEQCLLVSNCSTWAEAIGLASSTGHNA